MVRYFGLAKQTGFGSPAAPNKFIDVMSASPGPTDELIFPQSLGAREPTSWLPGQKYSEPEIETYIWPEGGTENVLHAFFQNVTSTTLDATNNVYQHEFRPAAFGTEPTYYTWEIGFDDVTALRIPNVVVNSLTFTFSSDEPPTLSVSGVGGFPLTASLATPSYPNIRPFINSDTEARIGGSVVELQELTIELNNNLERFHDLTAALKGIDLTNLEVSGSFSARFRAPEHLNRFLGESETSLQVTLTGPVKAGSYNYKLVIELPRIIYDAWESEVSGGELLVENVDFRAVKPTTDDVVKVTLINGVSSI